MKYIFRPLLDILGTIVLVLGAFVVAGVLIFGTMLVHTLNADDSVPTEYIDTLD